MGSAQLWEDEQEVYSVGVHHWRGMHTVEEESTDKQHRQTVHTNRTDSQHRQIAQTDGTDRWHRHTAQHRQMAQKYSIHGLHRQALELASTPLSALSLYLHSLTVFSMPAQQKHTWVAD